MKHNTNNNDIMIHEEQKLKETMKWHVSIAVTIRRRRHVVLRSIWLSWSCILCDNDPTVKKLQRTQMSVNIIDFVFEKCQEYK